LDLLDGQVEVAGAGFGDLVGAGFGGGFFGGRLGHESAWVVRCSFEQYRLGTPGARLFSGGSGLS
jgi:hypothetical protein